ncbi:unnamed protein product [Gadus morhua 'NCC']
MVYLTKRRLLLLEPGLEELAGANHYPVAVGVPLPLTPPGRGIKEGSPRLSGGGEGISLKYPVNRRQERPHAT